MSFKMNTFETLQERRQESRSHTLQFLTSGFCAPLGYKWFISLGMEKEPSMYNSLASLSRTIRFYFTYFAVYSKLFLRPLGSLEFANPKVSPMWQSVSMSLVFMISMNSFSWTWGLLLSDGKTSLGLNQMAGQLLLLCSQGP